MARIAVGGFQHETNTFSPHRATLADFEAADAWPAMASGDALLTAVAGQNLPIAGFAEAARRRGHTLLPLLWCAAPPSGPVRADAFDAILARMDNALAAAGPVDGLYLDLHGAMVSAHDLDGDGRILRHFRSRLGAHLPIVASLDLHANIGPAMIAAASALVAYRTYPHLDMAETGGRALRLMDAQLRDGKPRHLALRRSPFLVPLVAQCTDAEPAAGIYARLAALEARLGPAAGVESLSLAMGFPPADVPDCGPAVVAVGVDARAVEAAADQVLADLQAHESAFSVTLYSPGDALAVALKKGRAGGPVILADTQDNPGGGGSADTVGLLKACLAANQTFAPGDVLLGVFAEAAAAARAHATGVGGSFALAFGASHAQLGETPLQARFAVLAVSDGRFEASGPFYAGAHIDLGPMALLETGGVRLVVSTRKQQAADQAMFRHLGADPGACRVLGLKSSVHFRADFGALASDILVVEAPGLNGVDPRKLAYRNLPAGLRRFPMG